MNPLYCNVIMETAVLNNEFLTSCVLIILGELCEGSYNESVKFSTDVCRTLASWFRGLEVSTHM